MDSILVILFTFCLFGQCIGHGAMHFPNPWWSQSECSENMSPQDCEFHCYKEEEFASNCEPNGNIGCTRGCKLGVKAYYTNYTFVGKRTIEKEYITPGKSTHGGVWRWGRKSMGLHWQSRQRRRSVLWWILDLGKWSQNKQMETGMWGILWWTISH